MNRIWGYLGLGFAVAGFLYIWISVNLGVAIIFLALASGTLGGLCLKRDYDLILAKRVLAGTACSIALVCGYYWGFQAFVIGSIIAIIGYAIIHFKFKGVDGIYENNEGIKEIYFKKAELNPKFIRTGDALELKLNIVNSER